MIDKLPFDVSIKNKLEKLVHLILEEGIDCTKIILFGSYARAEQRANSDLDILVITHSEVPRTVRGELCSVFEENKADLIFYTEDLFKKSDALIVKQIRKEGILLWQN